MRRITFIGLAMLTCGLTACTAARVKRDLQHADDSQHYRASLASASEFDGKRDCTAQGTTTWTSFEFSESTPIVKLPSGFNAAAFCMSIPSGVRALEIYSDAKGGLTYVELTLIHPSVQFLTNDFQLLKDLQKPRLSPGSDFFRGLGLSGVVVLTNDLERAAYMLIYVHPSSLDGYVNVQAGHKLHPVPYGPYGAVEVKFR